MPISSALPRQFRDTSGTQQLLEYWDQRGQQWQDSIELFLNFDGDYTKFSSSQLDSIAHYFGYYSDYFWSNSWSVATKAKLLAGVYSEPYIWNRKGTESVLDYVFKAFNLNVDIGIKNGFIVDVSVVDVDTIGDNGIYSFYHPLPTDPAKDLLIKKIISIFFPIGISYEINTYQLP